jgi:hypothetical protein
MASKLKNMYEEHGDKDSLDALYAYWASQQDISVNEGE